MLNRSSAILTGLGLALMLPAIVFAAAPRRYTEDFTTTVNRDASVTTAWWNTTAGQLQLHDFEPEIVGSDATSTWAWKVVPAVDRLYVAGDLTGLRIYDVSDPSLPVALGHAASASGARGLAVVGSFAFVAAQQQGLLVYDVSDSNAPVKVGFYDNLSNAWDIEIAGGLAYVAWDNLGLLVLDISEPAAPVLVGSYNTPGSAMAVEIEGNLAYVGDFSGGLLILDLSNPVDPAPVGLVPGFAWGVAVDGDQVAVGGGIDGLIMVNVSEPANPLVVATIDTPGYVRGVEISGDFVYVADYTNGLLTFDIFDPANPRLIDSTDTPGWAFGVALAGPYAYVADGPEGIQVVAIAAPVSPPLVVGGMPSGVSSGKKMFISGQHLIYDDGDIRVVDISDPTMPVVVGGLDSAGVLEGVRGRYVYTGANRSHVMITTDFSNPTAPVVVDTLSFSHNWLSGGMDVSGAFVYFAHNRLSIINVSVPEDPVIVGELGGEISAYFDVAVVGNIAYVIDYDCLAVIDISDPTAPELLIRYGIGARLSQITAAGQFVYLIREPADFVIVDVSDLGNPINMGFVDLGGTSAGDIVVEGTLAYVAARDRILVVDISVPRYPVIVDEIAVPGLVLAKAGDHLFTAYGGEFNVIQMEWRLFDWWNSQARSLPFALSETENVVRLRLSTAQTGAFQWGVDQDDGAWRVLEPDGAWNLLSVEPGTMRWDAVLQTEDRYVSPVCDELQIEWLFASAVIDSIVDIPGDQGGYARLHFTRSGRDFADEPDWPATAYDVYRRIDDVTAAEKINDMVALSVGSGPVDLEGRRFLVAAPSEATPPGVWEAVASVHARQEDQYVTVVPTVADSSASFSYSTYFVTAHTTTPSVWYASQPDSGYSVDNLAPGVPTSITAGYMASGVILDWGDAPEIDFQFYRVYRGAEAGFTPSQENIIHETATSTWTDPTANPWGYYYKITVLDHTGNESEAGSPESVSGVQDSAVPGRTALLDAVPNPFNPSTKLSFEMATTGHARLKVYDTAGRLVAFLVDEYHDAGRHHVIWDGRDHAGRMSAAGVYLYRLEVGGFTETKRMVLIK